MTKTVDYPTIDTTSSTPPSVQIADHYRHAITHGRYAIDERLPRTDIIATQTGCGYSTVHDAINALAAEGLVTRQNGLGTMVRGVPKPRTVDADRYKREIESRDRGHVPTSSSIARDIDVPWENYSVEVLDASIAASTHRQAELMGINHGAPVYRRCTLGRAYGHTPLHISTSLMHPEHVRGTFFMHPDYTHRAGGTIEELRALGMRPDSGREWLRSRDATAEEVKYLKLYRGAAVYELTRVFLRKREVIESSELVMPAMGVTWTWALDLTSKTPI